jgi:methylenetetrahydrofolate reductase (NADPH)
VLLKGAKQLNFMNEKVAGIDVPFDVIQRIEKNTDPSEAAYELALEQARHALSLPGVRGIHIADFRHDETLTRLMTDLGRTPRTISKQLQEQL